METKNENAIDKINVGDLFVYNSRYIAVVKDISITTSLITGSFISYHCIAYLKNGMDSITFDVSAEYVLNHKIQ
jgi:hypothetical protein